MLNCLVLKTEKEVKGIPSTTFRSAIISMIDNLSEADKKKILFHLTDEEIKRKDVRKVPYVLFGKPSKSAFKIYAYDNEGLELLEKIRKSIHLFFTLKGKEFKIKDSFITQKDFIPKKVDTKLSYKTTTPILLFTKNQRRIYDAITNKYKDENEKMIELKKATNDLLIRNIKFQMQQLIRNKEYKVFDSIEIDWKELKAIRVTYKGRTEIAIVGEFHTNWQLPYFVGRAIGNGFGEIKYKEVQDER